MNESCTVLVLDKPIDYDCPPWCERTDHHADVVGPEDPPCHYGPEFGGVYVQSSGRPEAVVLIGANDSVTADTVELREVAANMVRAAEWLEAHQ